MTDKLIFKMFYSSDSTIMTMYYNKSMLRPILYLPQRAFEEMCECQKSTVPIELCTLCEKRNSVSSFAAICDLVLRK